MATAKKRGNSYRVRVYDKHTKKYKSFTAATKREAERLANEWLNGTSDTLKPTDISLFGATREYIDSKDGILSPSSIRAYNIMLNNAMNEIKDYRLKDINEKLLQKWVNDNSKKYSPKSVKSQYGLVTAVLRQNRLNLNFDDVSLPRLKKYVPDVPTPEQINIILHMVENTTVEIPVTMALTLGLRQSEIAGLKWEDYDGKYLHIHASKVPNADNKYQFKESVKSEASNRILLVPKILAERLKKQERKGEFISKMLPSSVLRKFQQLCIDNNLPEFTMHSLRHANASLMLLKNIPDKYAMKRLGQSSNNMIKDVYQHIYDDEMIEISEQVSNTFSDIYDHKYDHKK